MTRKFRYLLLSACIGLFFILAPLLVFYIRGIRYDDKNRSYQYTGLLAVRTEPKEAKIFLNGKETDTSPTNIRFLKPGEYEIKIQKAGYQEWTKRLEILPGVVSWANLPNSKIYLTKEKPETYTIATETNSYYKLEGGWAYISGKSLVLSDSNTGTATTNFTLPKTAENIRASKNNNLLLLTGGKTVLLFNIRAKIFTDLSTQFSDAKQITFDNDNSLWAILKAGRLVKIGEKYDSTSNVAPNVLGFTLRGNTLYYLQKTGSNAELFVADTSDPVFSARKLASGLPEGETELLVTEQKQIFALINKVLYRINKLAEPIAENIKTWHYEDDGSGLIFATPSELNFYDFSAQASRLISRNTNGFENPILKPGLGLAFYKQNKKLMVIELDTRSRQNNYVISEISENARFEVDEDGKNIFLLDNGVLKNLSIR